MGRIGRNEGVQLGWLNGVVKGGCECIVDVFCLNCSFC